MKRLHTTIDGRVLCPYCSRRELASFKGASTCGLYVCVKKMRQEEEAERLEDSWQSGAYE